MHWRLLYSAFLFIALPALAQIKVRFIVQEASAQKHDRIYLTGGFSGWRPNDSNYLLRPLDATHKTIAINLPAGNYPFNFTAGDWSKTEKNGACAELHRMLSIHADTSINILIKNWSDACSVNFFSGDKWYLLRTDSVSALAELMLSLTILLYLLSIKNKSADGWLITRYIICQSIYFLLSFLRNINETTWRMDIAEDASRGWLAIYHIWFSYQYKKKYFRGEMWIVLSLLILVIHAALLFEITAPPLHISPSSVNPGLFAIYMFAYLWSIAVFFRKSVAIGYTEGNKNADLAGRERMAFRSFGWWSILLVILNLNYLLMSAGVNLFYDPFEFFHILSLISLLWFAINYVNYAEEYTTFQVKLVGIMLCVTLLLLGVLAFLILPAGYIAQSAEGKLAQDAVNILTMLVPVMTLLIALVFQLIVKKNLLRPLKEVLKGVQRVNAGDLNVEVPLRVKDEIGFLSHNFNQMTNSLRQYAENMETLVAQRTSELEQKSTQLENQKEVLQKTLDNLTATQAQLIQSEKMASLGELTAGIAHEIQNPLNFVNNFSEVNKELLVEIQNELAAGNHDQAISISKEIIDNEEKITYHGRRADAIVKGMLQHSRKSTGQKESIDMNGLAEEYLRLSYKGFHAKVNSCKTNIQTEFDPSIGKINIIPVDIGRVFLNLYNNAYYAVHEKDKQHLEGYEPSVLVTTRKLANTIEIRIKDNGSGIPESIKDKIFQPFFTTKPTGSGTGLGLSLSYDIVKAHLGEIRVNSKEGEFTEFIISLPT